MRVFFDSLVVLAVSVCVESDSIISHNYRSGQSELTRPEGMSGDRASDLARRP